MNARYSNPDKDPNAWTGGDLSARAHPKPEDYGIQSPFTGEIHYPPGNRRWGVKKSDIKIYLEAWGSAYVEMKDPNSTLPSLVLKGTVRKNGGLMTPLDVLQEARERAVAVRNTQVWPQLFFLTDGEGRPRTKRYLKDVKKGRVPMTYWSDEEYETPFVLDSQSWEHAESGHSQAGINELAAIVGPKHNFETVKPLKLFSKIIQLWCPPSGIVLDPFAGSGTTGHAVLQLNEDAEASRRFILIEQSRPERGDAYARTLLAERLRRVITGKWAVGEQASLPGGFTFKYSTTKVDRDAVLAMQREEMVDLILMSHWETATRKGPMLTTLVHKGYQYLVAKDVADRGYFLVWEGPQEKTPLTTAALSNMIDEARKEGLSAPYHIYARKSNVLTPNVIFYQIPDEILKRIGFNDAFGIGDD